MSEFHNNLELWLCAVTLTRCYWREFIPLCILLFMQICFFWENCRVIKLFCFTSAVLYAFWWNDIFISDIPVQLRIELWDCLFTLYIISLYFTFSKNTLHFIWWTTITYWLQCTQGRFEVISNFILYIVPGFFVCQVLFISFPPPQKKEEKVVEFFMCVCVFLYSVFQNFPEQNCFLLY